MCSITNYREKDAVRALGCPKTGIKIPKQGLQYGLNVLVEYDVLDKEKENLLHARNSKSR